MPVLLNRYGHASLCAQWLILWALWVFVDPRRARASRWWWPAVLGVAAMVHSYLLLGRRRGLDVVARLLRSRPSRRAAGRSRGRRWRCCPPA